MTASRVSPNAAAPGGRLGLPAAPARPEDRASFRLATALALAALAMEAASLLLLIPNGSIATLQAMGFNGVGGAVLGAIYPVVGWLIASRRRDNPIGWMFLVVGLSQAGTAFASQYALFGLVIHPGSVPGAALASWLGTWSWVPGFVLLFVIILLFPDGRLRSPRWRVVLVLAGLAALLSAIPTALAAWQYRGPLLIGSVPQSLESDPVVAAAELLAGIGSLLMVPVAVAALASIVVRLCSSAGMERQQLKWFAAAAVIEISFLVVATFATLPYPLDVIAAAVVVPLIPIATAMAILRYRLYEIDRIVSRTIGWALSTGLVAAVFVAGVVLLQDLLAGLTQGATLAVAASTLLAFAAFQPLRRRIQRAVDRRFDRARYDGERTSAAFAERLRADVELDAVAGELVGTVAGALRPSGVRVWLRP